MAAFSEEIVEIKCDPHKILHNTYLYRFFAVNSKIFIMYTVLYSSSVKMIFIIDGIN